ncbi:hypothetical protein EIN_296810 [Entamoeba invadens IP1]|uniref:Uncharacterized protein n=1 Tax=Entamoeba invadens IP1 TaxID=370355 RepID=L7FMI2_ENTIV|nr:hypothetical protein EIN_296810 [Entamoeba invadens IP1]ELP86361.1 hypothetical protein EIN_296810 [Entamoeba invadens IP1]|eukprot:XP_004185707.1 hypothetical protein EIN_296810 [Entamoeba invadens IP1]
MEFPKEKITFLKAVEFMGEFEEAIPVVNEMKKEMMDFIQFVEESECENYEEIISSLNKISDDLYTNFSTTVTSVKPLYYENNPNMQIIQTIAFNYVHGIFHLKLWRLLTVVLFAIQDALLLSTCQSSILSSLLSDESTTTLLESFKETFNTIQTDLVTPDEVLYALKTLSDAIDKTTPVVENRSEKWKEFVVLSQPSHLMSIYHYIKLSQNTENEAISNLIKNVIDDLLTNGPVVEKMQEKVVCLIDDE